MFGFVVRYSASIGVALDSRTQRTGVAINNKEPLLITCELTS